MNNPLFNMFGGFQNFMSQFNAFSNNFKQTGENPQARASSQAQQMLDSGAMTQDQYNQILSTASFIRSFFK